MSKSNLPYPRSIPLWSMLPLFELTHWGTNKNAYFRRHYQTRVRQRYLYVFIQMSLTFVPKGPLDSPLIEAIIYIYIYIYMRRRATNFTAMISCFFSCDIAVYGIHDSYMPHSILLLFLFFCRCCFKFNEYAIRHNESRQCSAYSNTSIIRRPRWNRKQGHVPRQPQ